MMKKVGLVLIAILAIFIQDVYGWAVFETISGVVIDEKGELLAGVEVKTSEGQSVYTDFDGKFLIRTSSNKVTLTCQLISYQTKVQKISAVKRFSNVKIILKGD